MTTTKPFDLTKPVQTRDGRAARILCTDFKSTLGDYPIVAAVAHTRHEAESLFTFSLHGEHSSGCKKDALDLVNVPEKIERTYWLNLYARGEILSESRATLDNIVRYNGQIRLACVPVKIQCVEGEGLPPFPAL